MADDILAKQDGPILRITINAPDRGNAVTDDDGNSKGGARLLLSGTLLRKLMSEGKPVPAEFSKPEVIAVLKEYYDKLEEKVEVKLHGAATGDTKK